ncbi:MULTISPECIES: hypothetical protein [unclassified Burkholderia]|uniref:hypothetical protein n=1 Tax=unclassified Burkholderia TaxID=2613784 RepID=UPI00164C6BB2|nr:MULTISPECIES: hypothetical protein [unclassified Burkholderia]
MLRKAQRELRHLVREPLIDHVQFLRHRVPRTDYLKGEVAEADRHSLRWQSDVLLCADVANKANHLNLEFRPDPATHHVGRAVSNASASTTTASGRQLGWTGRDWRWCPSGKVSCGASSSFWRRMASPPASFTD